MFHSRKSNNKINLLHERALRMIYSDQISSFQELLYKGNSFTVHHFNIQSLAIEMFKFINNIASTIIDDLLTTYHRYNFRSKSKLVVPSVRTVHYGQSSIRHYGPLIWNMIHYFAIIINTIIITIIIIVIQKKFRCCHYCYYRIAFLTFYKFKVRVDMIYDKIILT